MSSLAGYYFKDTAGVKRIDRAIANCLICYGFIAVFSIALGNACMDIAAILACLRIFLSRKEMEIDKNIVLLFVLFFGALLVSTFFAYRPELSAQPLWHLFYYMVPPFFLGSIFIHTQSQRWALVLSMTTGGLVSSLYAFWQAGQGVSRATGFINMLELAGQLSMLIPVLVVVLCNSSRRIAKHWFLALTLMLSCVTLILNGTRGAWIAVSVVCLGYVLLFLYKNYKTVYWPKIIIAIVLVISVFSMVVYHMPGARERTISMMKFQDRNLGARFAMWPSAFDMFTDHLLVGVGVGNYHEQYAEKYARAELIVKHTGSLYESWLVHKHPHNSFLHLLAETGLLGFCTFLSLYLYVLFHFCSRVSAKEDFSMWANAALMVTSVFLLFGMSENVLFGMNQYTQALWLLIGSTWFKVPHKES